MRKTNMTFGGYPITFKMNVDNDDVEITCKGVTGLFSEGDKFLNGGYKDDTPKFGGRNIMLMDGMVTIDCLTDTKGQFVKIAKLAKKFRDREILNLKQQ